MKKPDTVVSFAEAKSLLCDFLSDFRCHDWRRKVSQSSYSTFPDLLGGIGALADLKISRHRGHEIHQYKEPVADVVLGYLINLCRECSRSEDLRCADPLACLPQASQMTIWKCSYCSRSQVNERDLRSFVAKTSLVKNIKIGVLSDSLGSSIRKLWRQNPHMSIEKDLLATLTSSGIVYASSDEWMRPCPACGSNGTSPTKTILQVGGREEPSPPCLC